MGLSSFLVELCSDSFGRAGHGGLMNERKQVLHGALFHDSGKLWQRTFDRAERPKQGKHQDLSRCFIEEHSDLFSDSDAVAKFAGGHHKRSEEMSEGELVGSIAHWLSLTERI